MNTNKLTCHCCTYNENAATAKECELCGTSLQTISNSELTVSLNKNKLDSPANLQVSSSQTSELSKISSKKTARKYKQFIFLSLSIGFAMGIIGNSIFRKYSKNFLEILQTNITATDNSFQTPSDETLEKIKDVPQGTFWYGSSIPFSPLHTPEILNVLTQAFPKFQTIYKEPPAYTKPGSSTSITMLLDGTVSFAELSRPLKDSEYIKAKERGVTLKQIPIASDGIVFFVHPSLPVDKLTINQVRKMILGKITNWQQVGGPNLSVVPFVFDPKIAPSTLRLLFEEPELEQFSSEAQYVRDYTDAIRKVSTTLGSISYASAAIIVNQHSVEPIALAQGDSSDYINPFTERREINTKALQSGNYPLTRRFFIGIRRDGTIDEQAGLAYSNIWLSKPGQKLIKKAGFIPIKNP